MLKPFVLPFVFKIDSMSFGEILAIAICQDRKQCSHGFSPPRLLSQKKMPRKFQAVKQILDCFVKSLSYNKPCTEQIVSKNIFVMLLKFWHILPKYAQLRQNRSAILRNPTADQVVISEVVLTAHLLLYYQQSSEQILFDLCQNALNSNQ